MPSAAHRTGEVPRFDVVDAVTPVGTAPCAECRGPIADTYYERDSQIICATCQQRLASVTQAPSGTPFGRALAFGLAAAALGAGIYFAVVALTGYEAGLVGILAGVLVGKAVWLGSRHRGGRRYQWLAVGLAYLAIASTYVPFVMKGFDQRAAAPPDTTVSAMPPGGPATPEAAAPNAPSPAPSRDPAARGFPAPDAVSPTAPRRPAAVSLGALLVLALFAPVLVGLSHVVEIAPILVALLVAWRLNRHVEMNITGPYRVRVDTSSGALHRLRAS